ncbi:hypothetical protein A176_001903 [Myxococcus hansupus]|uniref:Uncharacterized protein n=1 Tax=Pseudomyxococcus hansupus TaxID=1297742 RepID=A0A0H4WNI2_9BACT|nr:hypothetical protein [Myxococcus hansupus]AKQ64991.1 hypothetical protein A176_001903 [Myxococcus hansupus]
MGGGWGARTDGGATGVGQAGGQGDVVEVGGNAEDLGGMELEAFDFEFQIASF